MYHKRIFLMVILALLVSVLVASPAVAYERFNLSVNGEAAGMFEVYGEKGVSMMPVNVFARIAGADVNTASGNDFSIEENGKVLAMTIGKREALLDGEAVTLPVAPVSIEGNVFVPLRFVCSSFGFKVEWDEQQGLISLNREETRDGFKPIDLLVKSTVAIQEVNTCSMEGKAGLNMEVFADGKRMSETPLYMDVQISGQMQNDPMEIYMKQAIVPAGPAEIPATTVETYMTREKMYMKFSEQGWTVQDMPFPPEFLEQQQNPIMAARQMEEMGMFLNFGNDKTIDGADYYVVNATIDMNQLRQSLPDLMQQALQGLQPLDGNMQQNLQKILDNMKMDYYYTVYINKETMISDYIYFKAAIEMDMSNLGGMVESEGGEDGKLPGSLVIKMDMDGQFKIFDAGKPFSAPDVSDAQEFKLPQEENK